MRVHKLPSSAMLVLVAVVVAACNGKAAPATSVSPIPPSPTPTVVATATAVVPTLEAGKGNVHGWLSPTNIPLALEDTELYLGDIFSSDDGSFSTYYFDRTVHPRATWLNPNTGEFMFESVKPGEYVLILWWDMSSYIAVRRAGSTDAIRVEVTPDQITELGLIESSQ